MLLSTYKVSYGFYNQIIRNLLSLNYNRYRFFNVAVPYQEVKRYWVDDKNIHDGGMIRAYIRYASIIKMEQ